MTDKFKPGLYRITAYNLLVNHFKLKGFNLFAVRLYLAPPMLNLLHQKYRLEDREGVGKEVGRLEIHDMLTKNLTFSQIHREFRRYHTIIAIGNLLTVVCTFVHLHYLASKIVTL